jgi:hypothetical protein
MMTMKKALGLLLVLGLASVANAALDLVPNTISISPVNGTALASVNSSNNLAYVCWLEVADPTVANFQGAPSFTAGGNPTGFSAIQAYPEYGAWYQATVATNDPSKPLVAGQQISATLIGKKLGATVLNLYAEDGVTKLDSSPVTVVPEPMSLMLLGLGGLFLRRRS